MNFKSKIYTFKMRIINGDLLDLTSGYILQQCNCVSIKAKGLSESLRKKFPGTCPYEMRQQSSENSRVCRKEDRGVPGTLFILGNEDGVNVINLFGQVYPGKPGEGIDSYENRKKYFKNGLDSIIDFFWGTEDHVVINVPYKIGCGLAGGNWADYEQMLSEFEFKAKQSGVNLDVVLYRIDY